MLIKLSTYVKENPFVMHRFLLLNLLLIVFVGCSKDPYDDLSTSFEGVVFANPNEPLSGGQIEIIGSDAGSGPYDAYRKSFPIGSDGRFNIRITTSNIDLFQISLVGYSQSCSGQSITQYCTLMKAGEDHTGIEVYAY